MQYEHVQYDPSRWHNRFHSDLTLKLTDLDYKTGTKIRVQ